MPEVKLASPLCTGRFRAIVRGPDRQIRRETAFGRNTITNYGMNLLLSRSTTPYHGLVVGAGNTPPTVGDTTLDSYLGRYSTGNGTIVQTRNADPGAGPLYYRWTYTGTFNPGALGGAPVNVSEAGLANVQNVADINSTTPLSARGLLVDTGGAPTSIAVQPDEYLEIVWEFTEWLPYDAAGTFSILVNGVPTNFDYVSRPLNLIASDSAGGWRSFRNGSPTLNFALCQDVNGKYLDYRGAGSIPSRDSGAMNVALFPPATAPSGTCYPASVANWQAFVPDSGEASIDLTWAPSDGNVSGGISLMLLALGHPQWQISFNPPIPKTTDNQLNLTFKFSMANAP